MIGVGWGLSAVGVLGARVGMAVFVTVAGGALGAGSLAGLGKLQADSHSITNMKRRSLAFIEQ